MKSEAKNKPAEEAEKFVEGVDYYFKNGLMILTAHFLLKRGYCCQNGCLNCPYEQTKDINS